MDRWIGEIYRHLHAHPELSGQEEQTQAYIVSKLKELDIETTVYQGQKAVVGLIRGAYKGRTIALRADMDALPINEKTQVDFPSEKEGVMHACGHDAHVAIALGAAKRLMAEKDKLHGNVKLFFEPDEECRGGGRGMVLSGCMENPHVDAVIGLHMNPDFQVGTIYSKPGYVSGASTDIRIRIVGKSCHGAYPERGVDAIAVAAQVLTALQTLVSRNTSPMDSAALSIGSINGGSASNVICGEVKMHGTLRTLKKETEALLRHKMVELVQGIASAMGGEGEVVFHDSYASVYNDNGLHKLLKKNIDKAQLVKRKTPSLGVESFSFFSEHAPGLYYDLGCGKGTALHTDTFKIDERVLAIGASLQAELVKDYLKEGQE